MNNWQPLSLLRVAGDISFSSFGLNTAATPAFELISDLAFNSKVGTGV